MRRAGLLSVAVAGLVGLASGGTQNTPDVPLAERPPLVAQVREATAEERRIKVLERDRAKLERRVKVLEREVRAAKRRDRLRRLCLVPDSIVRAGLCLQGAGFRVSEHPAFGGVEPVHSTNSKHYPPCSCAIDVNAYANETATLDPVADWLRRAGFNVIWQAPGHYTHLHADSG